MRRLARAALAALALAVSPFTPLASQQRAVPFGVGEKMEYDVKFGAMSVGRGYMEVDRIEEVRGRPAWHTVFTVRGGIPFYRVRDRYESWLDTRTLASLRYVQQIDEGRYERERRYEIFPEKRVYIEDGEEFPSIAEPLDDGSFLYWLRTIPLEVGQVYSFERYFRPDRNPVTIRVLRRETVRVPAGTYDAIVIQPIIKARGIFSEKGSAEVWLSDDDRRIMLQMKSRLSFGSLNLFLKSYTPPSSTPTGR